MGYVKVDVLSAQAFEKATLGNKYDVDGAYLYQCWDLWALCVYNLCNTTSVPTKPGGGGAIDCWTYSRNYYKKLGFELITDKSQIQYGDWIVFSGGENGHIGMAVSNNLGNYVKLLGQNQTKEGKYGGATIINMSLSNFAGAFRWPAWAKKESDSPSVSPISPQKPTIITSAGITLAALATALGLTIPQIIEQNSDIIEINPNEQMTNEEAEKVAEAAEKALEKQKEKTPLELAKERAGEEGKIIEVQKWTGRPSDDGTIWTICQNHSSKPVQQCINETIENNKETITIEAAKHNMEGSGHWIFVGEQLVVI